MSERTGTLTLAHALSILARDIESPDGVANAAIAEGADRLRELDARVESLKMALGDVLSTFRDDDKTTVITTERQEAWKSVLHGFQ